MDKQKQVEEIKELASVLSKSVIQDYGGVYFLETAEELYEKRVRIIPENAVVLTRERNEWLTCCFGKFEEIMNDIKEQVRKETAEKFAEMLKAKMDSQQYLLLPTATVKQMIDEICKEITEGKA